MTKGKEKFLSESLKLSPEEITVISDLCNDIGTDKYVIWLGKEFKKNKSILEYKNLNTLNEIIDWAQSTNPDILPMSYEIALNKSNEFHEMLRNSVVKGIKNTQKIDSQRIIYRCSDKKHFFYSLKPEELKEEGSSMGHCVGNNPLYAKKLKKKQILILSLRDDENIPYITIEIDLNTGVLRQLQGRSLEDFKNKKKSKSEYLDLITEFSIKYGEFIPDADSDTIKKLKKLKK